MAQFVTIFLFQGMMSMTYFAFFPNIGLMIPFLQSYTSLTLLTDFMENGQQDMEFTVNREARLFIKF